MDKDNVLKVAEAIETHSIPALGFNMAGWVRRSAGAEDDLSGHNCRTVACIAGWAHMVAGGSAEAESETVKETAREFLGLGSSDSDYLFYAIGHAEFMGIRPAHSATSPSPARSIGSQP